MRKVIGIGETVLDIIFRNGQPQKAVPGGSTFNSMISIGRCGVPASFLSEIGDDKVGDIVRDFMVRNGVSSEYVNVLPVKSPVSLAFLDGKNDAEYIFHRENPRSHPAFEFPDLQPDDIVLFGSFYALNPAVRPQVRTFLEYARERGAIIYYDVNFRPSHVKDLGSTGNALWENLEFSDIVRGSHEDFITLFDLHDPEEVFRSKISARCGSFIYTCGCNPLSVRDITGFAKEYPVEKIPTVSTIGAGDNFNAGFIWGLIKEGITRETITCGLSEDQWDKLVASARSFSADCCQSDFNYVTPEFAKQHAL